MNVKKVGRELGVDYVLEGAVRRAGSHVRVTGQLIEVETGVQLWVERYDRSLNDSFTLQDEITMSMVDCIEPSLRRAEIERVKRQRPTSLDAYDLFLRGLPIIYTPVPQHTPGAIPLLEKARELEPGFAVQPALVCRFHQLFARRGLREKDCLIAIRHACAISRHGGSDANTLALAGFVILIDEHDHEAALKHIVSNSNNLALARSALPLAWLGETELASQRAQRALNLSSLPKVRACDIVLLCQAVCEGCRCTAECN